VPHCRRVPPLAGGFHATSIAEIIRESDLSAGSVYLYFKSKNEIIAAVVELTLGTAHELFAELLADDPTPSPEETVAYMVDAVMDEQSTTRCSASTCPASPCAPGPRRSATPEIADRIEQILRHLRRHYAHVARRWQAAGTIDPDTDPEHFGAVLLGIVHAFALQRLLIPATPDLRGGAHSRVRFEGALSGRNYGRSRSRNSRLNRDGLAVLCEPSVHIPLPHFCVGERIGRVLVGQPGERQL
jgi:AcrR family transcriptional regulator